MHSWWIDCWLEHLRETIVRELLLQSFHHIPANVVHLVIPISPCQSNVTRSLRSGQADHIGTEYIRLKLIALVDTGITTNRADVDHAIAEFNKGTALLWQLDFRDVSKTEVCELLVLFLAEPLNEAVAGEWLAQTVGHEAVLGEAKVKQCGDICRGRAQLLLLFDEVGTADLQRF